MIMHVLVMLHNLIIAGAASSSQFQGMFAVCFLIYISVWCILRAPKWVHCLFLFPVVLGKM